MDPNIGRTAKAALRRTFSSRRANMTGKKRRGAEARIVATLSALVNNDQVEKIAAFWPLDDEIDIRPFIRASLQDGLGVFLPRVNKTRKSLDFSAFSGEVADLVAGGFGILEPQGPPIDPAILDLIIVPALAYDLHGHRLGYGAGYYDRWLKTVSAPTVGVALDCMLIDILPTVEHDVAVDQVITETRVIAPDRLS